MSFLSSNLREDGTAEIKKELAAISGFPCFGQEWMLIKPWGEMDGGKGPPKQSETL